jgi:RNA polymerase sigma factor (sigma-70 family)
VRDEELVAAARAGDTEAFAALVARHRARIEVVVDRLVGDEAEDLVQEALLRAYLGLSQLRDSARFGAWLCGIAVNLAKMRLRRRALEARVAAEPAPPEPYEDRAVLQLVREAVEVLPAGQRDVVLMHYVEDLSCEEIAAVLGTSSGAVRVRLHRAREQLREELAVFAPTRRPKEEIPMIEMKLDDVVVRVAEDDPLTLVAPQRILVLAEVEGERLLPIWVGAPEGDALAFRLTGETTPRPMTSDLLVAVLRATGAHVEKVAVTALREKTFYGAITLAIDGRSEEIDARPSDALNLAVRVGAPIFVAEDVLEENALESGDLAARMESESRVAGTDLPEGEWRSLSAELLRSLYPML